MKILVVDDEQLLVKGIRFNLQNDGYDVIVGYNGAEALELAKTENPSWIRLGFLNPVLPTNQISIFSFII